MIDDILKFNREFVERGDYEKYATNKYPEKKLAVRSCMDTRLTELLPAALGLRNGDAKIIKNAGALIMTPYDSAMRSLLVAIYELGVEEIMVVAHTTCGACHMSFSDFEHHILERGISEQTLATIKHSGIDLDQWLEGFHDTRQSVLSTVETVRNHPLMPRDVVVRGFIIDSVTGALEEVK
jgi:carbonic anhydrase